MAWLVVPLDDATSRASSASTLNRVEPSGRRTSFPRTGPYVVSTVTGRRASLCRSAACRRTPIEDECSNKIRSNAAARVSDVITLNKIPARPFFITHGT